MGPAPKAAVLLDAVPMLPHRGGTVIHRIQPRGGGILHQEGVGYVGIAVITQRVQNIGCAEKARGHTHTVLADAVSKHCGNSRRILGLAEREMQDQDQSGLGITAAMGIKGCAGFRVAPGYGILLLRLSVRQKVVRKTRVRTLQAVARNALI